MMPDEMKAIIERILKASPRQSPAKEKAQLVKDWGADFEVNRKTAAKGARMTGATAEEVATLEKHMGYAAVMEMFRKIGAEEELSTEEAKSVQRR